jgi:hypothetical protein
MRAALRTVCGQDVRITRGEASSRQQDWQPALRTRRVTSITPLDFPMRQPGMNTNVFIGIFKKKF